MKVILPPTCCSGSRLGPKHGRQAFAAASTELGEFRMHDPLPFKVQYSARTTPLTGGNTDELRTRIGNQQNCEI